MLVGQGAPDTVLTDDDVQHLLAQAFDPQPLDGKRILVIIPDGTRTAPIPLIFRLLNDQLGPRVAQLDYLIALGTHQPMPDAAIERLVGLSASERAARYPAVRIFNHRWDLPETLLTIGTIGRGEAARLTDGVLVDEVPVTLNRLILDYDLLLICGPVFPHEVAGFSGGAKYLFPGIAGADIINFTHWLGALSTSMETIGVKDTYVRRVIHRGAEFVPVPVQCLALVLKGPALHGVFIGGHVEAWSAAADLSGQLNIVWLPQRVRRVLAMPSTMYDDLWTAAKAMYKTEPAIADGGEVIIYAPHITEISYTHGQLIDQIGYHVRDYFVKQWASFRDLPGGILAHSTHVKGAGSFDAATGVETPRITVTLATSVPEERTRRVNLGYADPGAIDPETWADADGSERLLVRHAGEMLYRVRAGGGTAGD